MLEEKHFNTTPDIKNNYNYGNNAMANTFPVKENTLKELNSNLLKLFKLFVIKSFTIFSITLLPMIKFGLNCNN